MLSASWRSDETSRAFSYHNDSLEILEGEDLAYNIVAEAEGLRRYVLAIDSVELRPPGEDPDVIDVVDSATASALRFDVTVGGGVPDEIGQLVTTVAGSDRYPIEIWAPLGIPLVCTVDGRHLGLPSHSVQRTTGEEGRIGVSFILDGTGGGRFVGRLLDADGEPWTGSWSVDISRRTAEGRLHWQPRQYGEGSDVDILVHEPGEYVLYFREFSGPPTRVEASILAGETVTLPDVRMASLGVFAGRYGNSVGVSPTVLADGMYGHVRVEYRNSSLEAVADAALRLKVPENLRKVKGTLSHDGEVLPVEIGADGVLAVPLGEITPGAVGLVRLQVQVEAGDATEAADIPVSITYQDHVGQHHEEFVGTAALSVVSGVHMVVPSHILSRTVHLHGRAPGDTTLTIFDGETMVGRTRVAPNGYWSLDVTLPDRGERWWHELKGVAVTEGGDEYLSPEILVLYDGTQPGVTSFSFRQDLEAWPEMSHWASLFEAAGEWEHVDLVGGVPRFPRQMLAGFPFQFELTFNDPDAVDDVSVFVDGAAGGEADLTRGDDDVFRGTIDTSHTAPWVAGMIHAEYRTTDSPPPTWSGTVSVGDSQFPDEGHDTSLDGSGVRYSARTPYEAFGGDLTGDYTLSLQAGYPGIPESPMDVQNLTWSVDGSGFTLRIEGYIPLSDFIARDNTHPEWPDGSRLIASEVAGDAVVLEWDPAGDQLWVDTYRIYQDDSSIGEVSGDVRRYTASGLTPGQSYTFRVDAYDPADRPCGGGPELTLTAGDTGAALDADGLLAFRTEADGKESEREAVMRAASSTFERLKTVNRWTGRIARPVNLLDWGRETAGLGGEFDRLDGLLDGLGTCVPAGNLGNLDDLVGRAKEALVLAQVVEGATIGAAFAAAATGVGLPGSAALTAAGLASGWAMRRASRNAEDRVEEEVDNLHDQFGECEDPEDPPRVRQPLADPVWKIDPSGYVYEVTEDNRIPGVTAVVFRSESEDGPWEVWDSDWYGEVNPQETDLDGRYGWDVPPDWWMVFYQKDGYEPAYSDALQVPPPHFDVNIPLKWLGPPSVEGINAALDGEAVEVTFSRYMHIDTLTPSTIRLFDADGEELAGTIGFAPGELVPNPHEDGDEENLSLTARFEPEEELVLGAEYTVLVNGMVQSYAEVPMGEDHEETVVVRSAHEVTVQVQPTDGGWVAGDGIHGDGDEVTLVATPATGYRLVSWTEAGTVVGTDEEYTFTLTEDRELVANFALREYTLTMEISHGEGTVSPSVGIHTFTHGTEVPLVAQPAEGWRFSSWTRNVAERKSAITTIIMEDDHEVAADFRIILACVTGVSIAEGDVSVAVGETVQLTAEVDPPTATNREVTWSSDDESAAVVDADGLVTGVTEGEAEITVITDDGGFTDTVLVTVVEAEPDPVPRPRPRPEPVDDDEPEVSFLDPRQGGVLQFERAGLVLEIPAGAFSVPEGQEVRVTVYSPEEGVPPLPAGYRDLGTYLWIGFSIIDEEGEETPVSPAHEITGILDVPGDDLDPGRLGLFRHDGDDWIYSRGAFDPGTGELGFLLDGPGFVAPLVSEITFTDIRGHWAQEHVEVLAGRQLVRGVDRENFAPDRSINRAEFATLVLRILELDAPTAVQDELPFADVPGDAWYAPAVQAAHEAGLVLGVSPTEFQPLRSITREELAVLLHRALEHLGAPVDMDEDSVRSLLDRYEDGDEVAPWAAEAAAWAVGSRIVRGRTLTTLVPVGEATRAEAVVMLGRFLQHICPFGR